MKKYYLHIGTENSGPFDIEELKAKKITTKTPVWFEGMERWKTAGEIEELRSVLVMIPPPIATFSTLPPTLKVEEIEEERKIMGLSKNIFLIVCIILIVAIGTIVFNTLRENKSRELDLKNHKTEVENYQYELQRKEMEEQKILMVVQEKIETERTARQKKQDKSSRLLEIQYKLVDYQNKLEATEKKLNNASGWKLLRTAADKKEQLDLLQRNIDSFKSEMNQLRNESDQLKLELEKIP